MLKSMTTENFPALFEELNSQRKLQEGGDMLAQVLSINENFVIVSAALKSDARIAIDEFMDNDNELEVKVGDMVEVEVELLENGMGETVLSRRNARRKQVWRTIEEAMTGDGVVQGFVQNRVRGGYAVSLEGIRAFLPGSLAGIFPAAALDNMLVGKSHEFKPIKVNRRRNTVVLSRRAVIERNMLKSNDDGLLANFEKDMRVVGTVRAITDYGAFLEISEGVYGLLHITDMSWKHTSSITDVMNIGDEVETIVLRVDAERGRISLGRKQLQPDPWEYFERLHPVGARVFGKVTKILDYGFFVEVESELQGLVHTSEMLWSRRQVHPSKVVEIGEEVEVMVLEIDHQRRRISLGLKQCKSNPWQEFSAAYRKGDKIKCKVSSVNSYGIFMELPGDIEGLVHMSEVSYEGGEEDVFYQYRKGQEVEVVILFIEVDRERIGLGIKQMDDEKYETFFSEHLKGADLQVKIIELTEKGAKVEIVPDGIGGYLPISEVSEARVEALGDYLKVGDVRDVALVDVDERNRRAIVSIKARDRKQREKLMHEKKTGGKASSTTLGALLQAKLDETAQKKEADSGDNDATAATAATNTADVVATEATTDTASTEATTDTASTDTTTEASKK